MRHSFRKRLDFCQPVDLVSLSGRLVLLSRDESTCIYELFMSDDGGCTWKLYGGWEDVTMTGAKVCLLAVDGVLHIIKTNIYTRQIICEKLTDDAWVTLHKIRVEPDDLCLVTATSHEGKIYIVTADDTIIVLPEQKIVEDVGMRLLTCRGLSLLADERTCEEVEKCKVENTSITHACICGEHVIHTLGFDLDTNEIFMDTFTS